jgi:nucleoside-diphosphate-sugar epimerase
MMRKKVAITGGAGRLGKYIVQDFLNHGWSVLSIDVVREVRRMCKSVACSVIQTVRT